MTPRAIPEALASAWARPSCSSTIHWSQAKKSIRSDRTRASLATWAEPASRSRAGQSSWGPYFSISALHRAKRSSPSPCSARKRSKSRWRARLRPAAKMTSRASHLAFQAASRSIGSAERLASWTSSRAHWTRERRGPDRRETSPMDSGRM